MFKHIPMKMLWVIFAILGLKMSVIEAAANSQDARLQNICNSNRNLAQIRAQRSNIMGDNICLNERYRFGHQLEKYQEECSVEPTDENLSFKEAIWTFYKCVVLKTLGDRTLTLMNYAEMMTENLSPETRAAIMSHLNLYESNAKISNTHLGEYTDNYEIKTYWEKYFDAEYWVCTAPPNIVCNKTEKARTKLQRIQWEPAAYCNENVIPKIMDINYKTPTRDISRTFKETHLGLNWTAKFDIAFYLVSRVIHQGKLHLADLDKPINFDAFYSKYIAFWFYTKSIKREMFHDLRSLFSKQYYTYKTKISISENIHDIFTYATKHLDVHLTEAGYIAEHRQAVSNVYIISELFQMVPLTTRRLCDFDGPTKYPIRNLA